MKEGTVCLALAASVSICCAVGCSGGKAVRGEAGAYSNPLVGMRADPWVYRHTDGYYYYSATHNSGSLEGFDRIILRRARSIAGIAGAPDIEVWRAPGKRLSMHQFVWAPEIHFIGGKWYLYVTASNKAGQDYSCRQYVLTCLGSDPLKDGWEETAQLAPDLIDSFSVDGTVFEHRGTLYYVWSQSRWNFDPVGDGHVGTYACLYIAQMKSPTEVDTSAHAMISYPKYEWEKMTYNVNEGPAILKRNGKVFIVYSASACDPNYCLGLLSADEGSDLLSPASWIKSPLPVFTSSEANSVYGPGHCSFTTEDGRDVIVYHARSYPGLFSGVTPDTAIANPADALKDPFRATRAKFFTWNADGTPDFGAAE